MIINVDDRCDIVLPDDSDDRCLTKATERGYLSHVIVSMHDGSRYPLFFIEPIRIQQDLDRLSKSPPGFLAEIGLVIVPDLDLATLKSVVRNLIDRGYFRYLHTIEEAPSPWDV